MQHNQNQAQANTFGNSNGGNYGNNVNSNGSNLHSTNSPINYNLLGTYLTTIQGTLVEDPTYYQEGEWCSLRVAVNELQ